MKKLVFLSLFITGTTIGLSSQAQVRVNAQININSQPDWGPVGYDYAQYYYLPDADMYYNVSSREYVYRERGRWINTRMLPSYRRNINLYSSYKVVINDRNPWMRHDHYFRNYGSYRGYRGQVCRRDNRRDGLSYNDRRDRDYDDDDYRGGGRRGNNGNGRGNRY
ncbi:MAG: hypothetical protein H7Y03_02935 [Chitinophagaceae bacterium]|nr:hypothetical protein [Chitinophagaceae bacterium]